MSLMSLKKNLTMNPNRIPQNLGQGIDPGTTKHPQCPKMANYRRTTDVVLENALEAFPQIPRNQVANRKLRSSRQENIGKHPPQVKIQGAGKNLKVHPQVNAKFT